MPKVSASVHYSLDFSPSTERRRWFGHDPDKGDELCRRYQREIKDNNDLIKLLKRKATAGKITLIYATRDEEHNGALVLKRFLIRIAPMRLAASANLSLAQAPHNPRWRYDPSRRITLPLIGVARRKHLDAELGCHATIVLISYRSVVSPDAYVTLVPLRV